MGLYDTVYIPCPECKYENEVQSKRDKCVLARYHFNDLEEIPEGILDDIKDTILTCDNCKSLLMMEVRFKVVKIPHCQIKVIEGK